MNIAAYRIQPGDTLNMLAGPVTVETVTRRDDAWVSNGVVYFTATDGTRWGLDRNLTVEVA